MVESKSFRDRVKDKINVKNVTIDESKSGSKIIDSKKICSGYNLYNGKLIDMKGKLVQEWPFRYLGIIQSDGTYLAQKSYESLEWGKFTFKGEKIWESNVPIHHDIIITPENTILTLTKESKRYKGRKVDFCVIVEFSQKGKEVWRWSSWENFSKIRKRHKALELDIPKFFMIDIVKRKPVTVWGGNYDYYRFNSLQIIPRNELNDSRFAQGNILVSIRHGSMIFVLNKISGEIEWFITGKDVPGKIEGQHSVRMLSSGKILIFDNGRYREFSRVIELDPKNMQVTWEYSNKDFFTLSQGYAQRLSNGNTLVTESEKGYVFEITFEGEKVWEFYHPDNQDKNNSPEHPESWGKRAWIYRMSRYNLDEIELHLLKS